MDNKTDCPDCEILLGMIEDFVDVLKIREDVDRGLLDFDEYCDCVSEVFQRARNRWKENKMKKIEKIRAEVTAIKLER
ncbi:unnamed protein product, partial [marine sediment metagenome]